MRGHRSHVIPATAVFAGRCAVEKTEARRRSLLPPQELWVPDVSKSSVRCGRASTLGRRVVPSPSSERRSMRQHGNDGECDGGED